MNKKRKAEDIEKQELIQLIEEKKIDKYIFLNTMKIILGDQNSRKNILKLLVLGDQYDMGTDIYVIKGYTLNFLNIIDFLDYKRGEHENKYDEQIDFIVDEIRKVKNKKEILIFYGKNLPDTECPETHYQSFIYMNKKLLCIDPSLGCSGRGIYDAYFTQDLQKKIKESELELKLGITSLNNPVEIACQSHKEEVFCQSWSLYLQYHFLLQIVSSSNAGDAAAAAPSSIKDLSHLKPVDIPAKQSKKNEILYDFYKEIINEKPFITKYDDGQDKSIIDLYRDNLYTLNKRLYPKLEKYIDVETISDLFDKFKKDDPLKLESKKSKLKFSAAKKLPKKSSKKSTKKLPKKLPKKSTKKLPKKSTKKIN